MQWQARAREGVHQVLDQPNPQIPMNVAKNCARLRQFHLAKVKEGPLGTGEIELESGQVAAACCTCSCDNETTTCTSNFNSKNPQKVSSHKVHFHGIGEFSLRSAPVLSLVVGFCACCWCVLVGDMLDVRFWFCPRRCCIDIEY